MKRSHHDGRGGNDSQRRRVSLDENGLREAVKVGQRASPEWKEAWCLWCDVNGQSIYDPAKYEAHKLAQFFKEVGSAFARNSSSGRRERNYSPRGSRKTGSSVRSSAGHPLKQQPPPPLMMNHHQGGASKSRDMVDFIKTGQKTRSDFKDMWRDHCDTYGGGTKDPNGHDDAFFTSFLFRYGVSEIGSQDWAKDHLSIVSTIAQPYIIAAIKAGKREDPTWKEAWANFVNEHATDKGTLDPARQDCASLFEFMETVGLAQFADKPWILDFMGGKQPAEPAPKTGGRRR